VSDVPAVRHPFEDLPPWHVACRADILVPPDTIAGILDGDGCLTLVRRVGRPVPVVALSMRDDDPTPIAVARSVAAYVGRSIGHITHRGRVWHWRVTAVADIGELVRFVERHPLLSPRGAANLAAIGAATAILRSVHGRTGRHGPLSPLEATRLEETWRLTGLRDRPGLAKPLPDVAAATSDDRLHAWFAGFVAAEGLLGTQTVGGRRRRPLFAVTQRDDNLPLLLFLRERLGLGRVHPVPVKVGHPASVLTVTRTADLETIARILRADPLPDASPKAGQFDLWAELVSLTRATYRTRWPDTSGVDRLAAATASQLADMKRYGGRASLCDCLREPTCHGRVR
jgi:hypothetical protein